MSFQAMALVASLKPSETPELEQQGFKTIHKCLLFQMANYANEQFMLWPCQETLANDCSCTSRTIRSATEKLVEWGFLSVSKRSTMNGRQANVYKLNIVEWFNSHDYVLIVDNKGFQKPVKKIGLQAAPDKQPENFAQQPENFAQQPENFSGDPVIDPINETNSLLAGELNFSDEFAKQQIGTGFTGDIKKVFAAFQGGMMSKYGNRPREVIQWQGDFRKWLANERNINAARPRYQKPERRDPWLEAKGYYDQPQQQAPIDITPVEVLEHE